MSVEAFHPFPPVFKKHLSYYFNPFSNKPRFLCVFSTSLLKTQWEKEKLLVTSNFSFSYCVFYPLGGLSGILIKSEFVVNSFSLGVSKTHRLGKG